ncbi:AAC(3)-I family aminoglycoside N-acetyltransferase [Arenimonas sp. MALMAid1274]|uniref:AAC(3)-I family aminoglycoside N-acetyltransferase n=1 Tax=Arenimonas sp. MALMAid1274 TaxID=3411630 RepID=UPI003BA19F53
MAERPAFTVRALSGDDLPAMHGLLTLFGEAFFQPDVYGDARPDDAYLRRLLDGDSFIAVVAEAEGRVIGGIGAYELRKFEQARSEIYLYDLAVAEDQRRRGVATALIRRLQAIARERGAYVVFVQADLEDAPAVALYTKLGLREEVLHFDLPLDPARGD